MQPRISYSTTCSQRRLGVPCLLPRSFPTETNRSTSHLQAPHHLRVHTANMVYNPARAPVWRGKIAVEEAMNLPDLAKNIVGAPSYSVNGMGEKLSNSLADIHGRVEEMDRFGIEHIILSLTSPGPQGKTDKQEAEDLARRANDYLAGECAKNPARFSSYASVSMHDPTQAAKEVRRAITELGMCGVIVNDFQSIGDENSVVFYDQSDYDVFW